MCTSVQDISAGPFDPFSNPVPPMDAHDDSPNNLVVVAATLRAGGLRWDAIAKAVNRSAGTVRRWPYYYRETWDRAFAAEEDRLIAGAAAEARLTLRAMLTAPRSPHRLRAAQILLQSGDTARAVAARTAPASDID